MKSTMPKLASLAAFSCIWVASAFATMEDRLDTLEKEMQEISTRNPQNTLGARFTTASPQLEESPWFLNFDITYWHAKMGGTEYAYSVRQAEDNRRFPLKGDVKDNDFKWDFGFKGALGYKAPHNNWDLSARYTWFQTECSTSSTKVAPSGLISLTWWEQIIASRVKSHIDIDYNNLEVEFARSYFMSHSLSLRSHLDIKSSWININRNVILTASGLNSAPNIGVGLDYKTKEHTRFLGLGPRIGLDSQWFLGSGFNIFGDFSTSLLYGYFKNSQKNIVPPSTDPTHLPDGKALNITHKFHRFIPFYQMHIGLEWARYINDDKQHVAFKLGYEIQYFWRVNQMHQPEGSIHASSPNIATRIQFKNQSEDLMFYGITGQFRLDF